MNDYRYNRNEMDHCQHSSRQRRSLLFVTTTTLCWILLLCRCCQPVTGWVFLGPSSQQRRLQQWQSRVRFIGRSSSRATTTTNLFNLRASTTTGEQQQQQQEEDVTKSIIAFQIFLQDIYNNLQLQMSSSSSIEGENNNNITTTARRIVQETMLRTRIDTLVCNKTRVGPSTIPYAGQGLFAIRDCIPGEIVTCYPGDALLIETDFKDIYDDDDDDNNNHNNDQTTPPSSNSSSTNQYSTKSPPLVIWGDHVIHSNELLQEARNFKNNNDDWQGYQLGVCEDYTILGLPNLSNQEQNPSYLGHFANDACRPMREGERRKGDEKEEEGGSDGERLSSYVLQSQSRANAMHQTVSDLHMVTVALRPISHGEEIFVSYGPAYWMNHDEIIRIKDVNTNNEVEKEKDYDWEEEEEEVGEMYEDDFEYDYNDDEQEVDYEEEDWVDDISTSGDVTPNGKGFG